MPRDPTVNFTVRILNEDEIPPTRPSRYYDIVKRVAESGKGRALDCNTPDDAHAVYNGIKRAVDKFEDSTRFIVERRTNTDKTATVLIYLT